jgi:bifunctional DNA-binding transcriptional regulator/antitoxin component of YhaV-PrlF toxin-antitoxin module
MNKQEYNVPKVSIHGNQLTLPDDLREALASAEDDILDAEEVDEGLLLKRSPSARRKAGLADMRAAQAGVRYIGPLPRPSAEEEEQQIADMLYAEKKAERDNQKP